MNDETVIADRAGSPEKTLSFFEKYLSVWVALCIGAGIAVGQFIPAIPNTLGEIEYARVNVPIAILIWFTIYPMMVEIDFQSILNVRKKLKGLLVTLTANWLVQPLLMYFIYWLCMTQIFDFLLPA